MPDPILSIPWDQPKLIIRPGPPYINVVILSESNRVPCTSSKLRNMSIEINLEGGSLILVVA